MLSFSDDETNVKERFFEKIEEIWELNYCGETVVPMFRVRWAKNVRNEGRYFTTMVILDAKSRTHPRKMSHGYSLAKLTNASSSPTPQGLAVLS